MPASRLGIRSLGASGSAGVGAPAAGWGPGCVCARVRGAEGRGLLRAWLCLGAAGRVSAGASRRTAQAAGSLGYLSRSVLGGCAQISGRRLHWRDALSGRGGAEKRDPGPDGSGREQSMEQRRGRAGKSKERPVSATGRGWGLGGGV